MLVQFDRKRSWIRPYANANKPNEDRRTNSELNSKREKKIVFLFVVYIDMTDYF